jgi:hypothetical protein
MFFGSEHAVGYQSSHDKKDEDEYDGGCNGRDVIPELVSSFSGNKDSHCGTM